MKKQKIRKMTYCSFFTVLIIIGAFIKIPIPFVPMTLQYLFTMLAGLILGPYLGSISVLLYIFMGLIGLPVFTQGGGLTYVFQPTFGYIIGFVFGTFITGFIAYQKQQPSYLRLFFANILGMSVVYLCGYLYYYLISMFYLNEPVELSVLFVHCVLIVLPGDIISCIFGVILVKRLIPFIKKKELSDIIYNKNVSG